jgi:AcrR family transcriptional regulator
MAGAGRASIGLQTAGNWTPMDASEENYQSRVGAARREKTRNRLIETALGVFAEKGPDLPIIDDFIAAAGVARGTFYNYFRTTGELLVAVAGESSDQVLGVIDPLVLAEADPVRRLVVGSGRIHHAGGDAARVARPAARRISDARSATGDRRGEIPHRPCERGARYLAGRDHVRDRDAAFGRGARGLHRRSDVHAIAGFWRE